MSGIDGPRREGLKGAPSTGTIEGRQRSLRANGRKSSGYPPDGTPGDAFCKPGQYDEMTKGRMYRTTPGATRWNKGRGDHDEDDY